MEKETDSAYIHCINLKMEWVGVLDSKQMLNKVKNINKICKISSVSWLWKRTLALQASIPKVCAVL